MNVTVSAAVAQIGRRNKLLGSASLVIAGGVVLAISVDVLLLIVVADSSDVVGLTVGQAVSLFSDFIILAAATLVGVGLLVRGPLGSARVLVGMALFAGATVLFGGAQVSDTIIYGVHHANGTFVAANGVEAAAFFALCALGFAAALAFAAYDKLDLARQAARDYRLGVASSAFAAGATLYTTAAILSLIAYSDVGAPSGFTTGFGITAAGWILAAGAGVVGASAFVGSAARQRGEAPGWVARRDMLLTIATSVLVAGLLLVAVGAILITAATSSSGGEGKAVAAGWLHAIQYFVYAGAFVVAAVGFSISRRPA